MSTLAQLGAEMVGTTRQHIGTRDLFAVLSVIGESVQCEYMGRQGFVTVISVQYVLDVTERVA